MESNLLIEPSSSSSLLTGQIVALDLGVKIP